MFVLTVSLRVHPEHVEEFRDVIAENATASVRDEPGCRQFDVVELDEPGAFVLYEVYDSTDAFAAHKAAPHFRVWREAADRLVAEQVNRPGTLVVRG